MLSRVADNLYWMSRYLERAEHAARVLAVHLNLVLDQEEEPAALRRHRVLNALYAPADDAALLDDARLCRIVGFQLDNANSIVSCIRSARENARQVREQINLEMWQQLNELYLYLRDVKVINEIKDSDIEFFEDVIEQIQLFQGITDGTMNHGQGWQFIQIGRFLERAINAAHLLDIEFEALAVKGQSYRPTTDSTYLEWLGLLKTCTAFEAYSKVYTFDLRPEHIAEFLLLNPEFPHSVSFSIGSVQNALAAVAEATETHKSARVYRLSGRLGSALEFADIQEIIEDGLDTYLAQVQQQCNAIHGAIYQNYIAYPVEEKLVAQTMHYTVYHLTRFRYAAPVFENVMEVRMAPRDEGNQRCSDFELRTRPAARVFAYQDHWGNAVHYFDCPAPHRALTLVAVSTVNVAAPAALPEPAQAPTWQAIDELASSLPAWEFVRPSDLTTGTALLDQLAAELEVSRRFDSISALTQLNQRLYRALRYDVDATKVDSPIDVALTKRRGVCQDYAHIMLALVRNHLQMPCRYVSGYLYHTDDDRSADGASHAWIEVLLPDHGWIGFDPTNDILAGPRHIRVATGMDYRDAPPTRGTYKGNAQSDLDVRVRVRKIDEPDAEADLPEMHQQLEAVAITQAEIEEIMAAQQQQQQ